MWLEKNPLATYSELAGAFGISPPTAKTRLAELMSSNNQAVYGVSATLNLNKLGLELHSFRISLGSENKAKGFRTLEKIADSHPYTSFFNRCFGGSDVGALMQFTIPENSSPMLVKLIGLLQDFLDIRSVRHFGDPLFTKDTFPDIRYWVNGDWNFDFFYWLELTSEAEPPSIPAIQSVLHDLTIIDIILLRELMIDARRKQVQIRNDIQKSSVYSISEKSLFTESQRKHISQRLTWLNSHGVVNGYRLRYNKDMLGLNNQILFSGKLSKKRQEEIISLLEHHPIPFRSSCRLFRDGTFFWWMNLPPKHTSEAVNFVNEISTQTEIHLLDVNPVHSKTYPLWHRNFEPKIGFPSWKVSTDWMIYSPLSVAFQDVDEKISIF